MTSRMVSVSDDRQRSAANEGGVFHANCSAANVKTVMLQQWQGPPQVYRTIIRNARKEKTAPDVRSKPRTGTNKWYG
jgi:hypothetical protein